MMVLLFAENLSAADFALFGSAVASVSVQLVNLAPLSSRYQLRFAVFGAAMVVPLAMSAVSAASAAGDDHSSSRVVISQDATEKMVGMSIEDVVGSRFAGLR